MDQPPIDLRFQAPKRIGQQPPVRTLKIEADGDFFKGRIKPKIRIMGHWLERAGFKPGTRVCLTCVARGVIELRSAEGASEVPAPANPHEPGKA